MQAQRYATVADTKNVFSDAQNIEMTAFLKHATWTA
jgi:hypothetical protein